MPLSCHRSSPEDDRTLFREAENTYRVSGVLRPGKLRGLTVQGRGRALLAGQMRAGPVGDRFLQPHTAARKQFLFARSPPGPGEGRKEASAGQSGKRRETTNDPQPDGTEKEGNETQQPALQPSSQPARGPACLPGRGVHNGRRTNGRTHAATGWIVLSMDAWTDRMSVRGRLVG